MGLFKRNLRVGLYPQVVVPLALGLTPSRLRRWLKRLRKVGTADPSGLKPVVMTKRWGLAPRLNRLRKKSKLEPSWGIGMHRLNC